MRESTRSSPALFGAPESIAVVFPAFNVERELGPLLAAAPEYLRHLIIVDDASRDATAATARTAAARDPRVLLVQHERNGGVGAAVVSGFRRALELGATIVVKMDGDGQMAWADLPRLLTPLVERRADYAKGNRFRDFRALRRMPPVRRAGNMALSFMAKAATGYWTVFDPTNGYLAMRSDVLERLRLDRLDRRYFFEQSLLAELYLANAVVADVELPARYADESSHLSVGRVLVDFPPKLLYCLVRRVWLKNFIYDFTIESVYLLTAIPMVTFGLAFGLYHWIRSATTGVPATTGTVVLPALLVILGVQFFIAALEQDISRIPREPLSQRPEERLDPASPESPEARGVS